MITSNALPLSEIGRLSLIRMVSNPATASQPKHFYVSNANCSQMAECRSPLLNLKQYHLNDVLTALV